MAGYGNRKAPDYNPEDYTSEHTSTRLGLTDSAPYSNAHPTYGSASTAGAGFGNKHSSVPGADTSADADTDTSSTPADLTPYPSHTSTAPYTNASPLGSGSTAGAGYGNKTGSFGGGHSDSMMGKLVQKAGHVMHSGALEEKGRGMREGGGGGVGK
ncbi:hypothetical protein P153DRAFT_433822 [Dothidotthia symphoricarpi CBS 119687]|uniref:Uncharacterized protein n=1 Tax=Dothidotthia symphoricarpi CBS 119687 TaxID=1392245 RepID=A0A6A6A2I5_9PLEO|nr:uncharacterized protein P153DRAFT_433822 [Dothidotthia symphoricarpi CBS 119687]KAF2126010.1 hypothetical protein P153DRAFT_433822 [Dothidotthia symphoricarpi CBS 119687]